jgi:ferredoxin
MGPRVRFLPDGRDVRIEAGATLHDAVRRAGLPIASACGADGICGRCGVEIVTGAELLPQETEHERAGKQRYRVPAEERLACRVSPRGDVCIRASYW